ncbi:osmoprotectant transport system permease protein [Tamilnaduibacter salinus]|uniref:Osmoprotectant transport system permease protein n=1 Tax=Tamilnaduibacter salinus TaxID=1484056 RepID=A0A2U1CX80_9GAMM|nr:ABC transporter permease [Tamilnaduibacter salinus]PVY76818.1 osmoprotectant transport system permease protein [Tamilnaduibacter salinus]
MPSSRRPVNRVLFSLSLLALALLWGLDTGTVVPNRIMPGTGHGPVDGIGIGLALAISLGLAGVALLALLPSAPRDAFITVLLTALLVSVPFLLDHFITRKMADAGPYARAGIGAGLWCLLFLLVLMLGESLKYARWRRLWQPLILVITLGAWGLAVSQGRLDALALVREFQARPGPFMEALSAHLLLAIGSVLVSLLIGFLLAVSGLHRPRWRSLVLNTVSFLQTIPSLALFGLLIAPLSLLVDAVPALKAFGISGIGWAPAFLALVAYSLLPMVRNTHVALTGVASDVLDAAQAMGMNGWQRFVQVRLPLAMPVVLEGIRITTIQAIGLTAVAALVGAGGFGTFIFQGLGQAAMDLVMLGALPTIALALIADTVFGGLTRWLAPPGQEPTR